MQQPIRVLFVCLGNICRSPMAEALFRTCVQKAGLEEHIHIASTGLGTWNLGNPPHPDTQAILEEHDIPFDGMRSKVLETEKMNTYDYIIAMDQENVSELFRRGVARERVQFLTDYVPGKAGEDVPDPYYYGNFDGVFSLIQTGVQNVLEHIIQAHQLNAEQK